MAVSVAARRWSYMTTHHELTQKSTHAWNGLGQRSSFSTHVGEQPQAPLSFFSHFCLFVRIAAGAYVLQLYIANCTLVGYAAKLLFRSESMS